VCGQAVVEGILTNITKQPFDLLSAEPTKYRQAKLLDKYPGNL
jgi:hypothetical protein